MSHVTRTLTRGGLLVLLAALLSCFVVVPFAQQASAASTPSLSAFDARLLYDINHARTSHGIRALTVVAGTTDVAHGWSCHLAGVHLLSHNGRLGTQLE